MNSADLPLETEPIVFFHPVLAGTSAPGRVQPVPDVLLLDEEPAIWPEFTAPGSR